MLGRGNVAGASTANVAHVLPGGSLEPTFGASGFACLDVLGGASVQAIAHQSGGRLVGGTGLGGTFSHFLVRLYGP